MPRPSTRDDRERPRALSVRLTLPSSQRVRLVADAADAPGGAGSLAALEGFDTGAFRLSDGRGRPVLVGDLSVEDFQVLRALLTARGHLSESLAERRCDNCGATLSVHPCDSLEFGPFLDGELDAKTGVDAPFDYDRSYLIEAVGGREPHPPAPSPTSRRGGGEMEAGGSTLPSRSSLDGAGEGSGVRLSPVTVSAARPVFAAAAKGGEVEPTTGIVEALGVTRLDDETDAGRIARRLRQAPPGAWGDLAAHVHEAWYPGRLMAWIRCDECDAGMDVEAPADREFLPDLDRPEVDFEPFDVFAARVERVAAPLLARRGARDIELIVEPGPAACDDGGVPLLGSYDPPLTSDHGVIGHGPQVRIYHRGFYLDYRDHPFDLDLEIADTIDHELDHHDAWRSGDDPVDDDERAAIVDEERVRVGDTEAMRRASRAARGSVGEFLRRTWPLWLVAALVALAEAYAR